MGGSHHAHYREVTTSETGTSQRTLENALMQNLEACGAVERAHSWKALRLAVVCVRMRRHVRECV